MMRVYGRFTTTEGKGIGRWWRYGYDAEDWADVRNIAAGLVPSCEVKVTNGRERKTLVIGKAAQVAKLFL